MFKKKNFIVIVLSCVIIVLAGISAFLGYLIHIQWKYISYITKEYNHSIRLDTLSYRNNIKIQLLDARLNRWGRVSLRGNIVNRGKKAVDSLLMEVYFLDEDGNKIFSFEIYPLLQNGLLNYLATNRYFRRIWDLPLRGRAIKPYDSTHFEYTLYNCPRKIIQMVQNKSSASNNRLDSQSKNLSNWDKIGWQILELRIIDI